MKRHFKLQVVIPFMLCLLLSVSASGQDTAKMVKYTPEFRFNDGIYLNFEQLKTNSPIPKSKLLTSADYNERDFYTKVFAADKIYFYDELGVRQEVAKDQIWGYSRNGVIYVMIQGSFNRITFVGNICHFVADITSYETHNNYYSPYGYYDPYYYSPYGYSGYGGYSPYGSYYSPYGTTQSTRNELKQYIFDFETGKVVDFSVSNVQLMIMKDAALYEEYVQLPKKKQKELMFVYVRKFNEKNPLYLPGN
jgi:hypothetical protein